MAQNEDVGHNFWGMWDDPPQVSVDADENPWSEYPRFTPGWDQQFRDIDFFESKHVFSFEKGHEYTDNDIQPIENLSHGRRTFGVVVGGDPAPFNEERQSDLAPFHADQEDTRKMYEFALGLKPDDGFLDLYRQRYQMEQGGRNRLWRHLTSWITGESIEDVDAIADQRILEQAAFDMAVDDDEEPPQPPPAPPDAGAGAGAAAGGANQQQPQPPEQPPEQPPPPPPPPEAGAGAAAGGANQQPEEQRPQRALRAVGDQPLLTETFPLVPPGGSRDFPGFDVLADYERAQQHARQQADAVEKEHHGRLQELVVAGAASGAPKPDAAQISKTHQRRVAEKPESFARPGPKEQTATTQEERLKSRVEKASEEKKEKRERSKSAMRSSVALVPVVQGKGAGADSAAAAGDEVPRRRAADDSERMEVFVPRGRNINIDVLPHEGFPHTTNLTSILDSFAAILHVDQPTEGTDWQKFQRFVVNNVHRLPAEIREGRGGAGARVTQLAEKWASFNAELEKSRTEHDVEAQAGRHQNAQKDAKATSDAARELAKFLKAKIHPRQPAEGGAGKKLAVEAPQIDDRDI